MGSWLQTCMISNLPIDWDEKVKVIFLEKNIDNIDSGCYPTCYYKPIHVPLDGIYNDYGYDISIEKNYNYDIILNYFKEILGDKIIINDKEIENYDLSIILKGIERKELKLLENYNYVLIKENIWNIISNIPLINYYWKKSISDICLEKFNNWKEDAKACTECQENYEKTKIYGKIPYIRNFMNPDGESYPWFLIYSKMIFENVDINNIEDLFKKWRDFVIVNTYMEETKNCWRLTSGKGSQTYAWELHKMLAEKIIDICN